MLIFAIYNTVFFFSHKLIILSCARHVTLPNVIYFCLHVDEAIVQREIFLNGKNERIEFVLAK